MWSANSEMGLSACPRDCEPLNHRSAAVSNSVDHQREAGIDARLKTVEVFLANAKWSV